MEFFIIPVWNRSLKTPVTTVSDKPLDVGQITATLSPFPLHNKRFSSGFTTFDTLGGEILRQMTLFWQVVNKEKLNKCEVTDIRTYDKILFVPSRCRWSSANVRTHCSTSLVIYAFIISMTRLSISGQSTCFV